MSTMTKRHRLFENIVSLFVLQGANYLLPLITLPYLVRVLGPEKFGLVTFAQAFIAYFVILADYGFNLSATREIAMHRHNLRKVAEIFSAVITIKLCLMITGFFIMAGIVYTVPHFHADWPVYWVSYLAVAGSALFPIWLFQGMERMSYITSFNIVARTVVVVGIFLWVNSAGDYIIAAGLQAAAPVLAGILSWPVVLKLLGEHRPLLPSRIILRGQLKEGWHAFLSTSAISLYTASNTFILGLIAGNTAAGLFSAAEKLIKAVQGLLGPISQAIYPHINALIVQSRTEALAFIYKSLRWIGTLSFLASISIFTLAESIVTLALGPQFQETVPLLRWMAFLPFIIALSNVFGIQTMLAFGLKKEFSRILVSCGLFNLVIIVPLVYVLGAQGTALSVLLTETLVTVSMGLLLARRGIWPWFGKERFA
ncbi:MAG: flippase [Firmicutes bacterium]|nr:flippase [Bacillota bacterium]